MFRPTAGAYKLKSFSPAWDDCEKSARSFRRGFFGSRTSGADKVFEKYSSSKCLASGACVDGKTGMAYFLSFAGAKIRSCSAQTTLKSLVVYSDIDGAAREYKRRVPKAGHCWGTTRWKETDCFKSTEHEEAGTCALHSGWVGFRTLESEAGSSNDDSWRRCRRTNCTLYGDYERKVNGI